MIKTDKRRNCHCDSHMSFHIRAAPDDVEQDMGHGRQVVQISCGDCGGVVAFALQDEMFPQAWNDLLEKTPTLENITINGGVFWDEK